MEGKKKISKGETWEVKRPECLPQISYNRNGGGTCTRLFCTQLLPCRLFSPRKRCWAPGQSCQSALPAPARRPWPCPRRGRRSCGRPCPGPTRPGCCRCYPVPRRPSAHDWLTSAPWWDSIREETRNESTTFHPAPGPGTLTLSGAQWGLGREVKSPEFQSLPCYHSVILGEQWHHFSRFWFSA